MCNHRVRTVFRKRVCQKYNKESSSVDEPDLPSSINYNYLPNDELIARLRTSRESESKLKDKLFLLSNSYKKSRNARENYKQKIKELCSKGTYNAIAYNVIRAVKESRVEGKEGVLDMIETISENLMKEKSSKGMRHKQCSTTQEYYEALLIMFGPKCAMFAADNWHGPHIDTVRQWKKVNTKPFDFDSPQTNLKLVAELYKSLKIKHEETRPIPFLMMEDETVIDPRIEYDAKSDSVYGYCGLKGENHKCADHYTIKVKLSFKFL